MFARMQVERLKRNHRSTGPLLHAGAEADGPEHDRHILKTEKLWADDGELHQGYARLRCPARSLASAAMVRSMTPPTGTP
jgi:hypothetical protein